LSKNDVTIGDLAEQNPWWKTGEFPSDDPEKERYEASSFKWKPRLLRILESEDVIYTLRGPRRVGKTTSLKLIIEQFLSEGVLPKNIFYFSCDQLYNLPYLDQEDLAGVLTKYLNFRESKERAFIFIDEVTRLPDWQRRIEPLLRKRLFKNCTAIFTGNHCIDVRKRPNSLVDLRGEANLKKHKNPNLVLLQPKFSEYVETQDKVIREHIEKQKLHTREKREELLLSLANNTIPDEIDDLMLYIRELNSLLSDYLITGGNCQAVHEFLSTGTISQSTYNAFIELIRTDIMEWGYNEYFAKQILGRIIETITTPVTWNSLKGKTAAKDHKTSNSYAELLIDTFIVNCHYKLKVGKSSSKPYYSSQDKKIYIRNPFVFHACNGWVWGRDMQRLSLDYVKEHRSRLLEGVFSDHLARLMFKFHSNVPCFKPSDYVFFWKSTKIEEKEEKEVDFVVKLNDKSLAVEVKDTNKIKSTEAIREFTNTADAYKCGIITSDTDLKSHHKYVRVPASILLLLM
jgi:predicted AAA+ superfamily ATPase